MKMCSSVIFQRRCLQFVITFLLIISSWASKSEQECSNIGCVHASATLFARINNDIKPCEDFYDFACGTFINNTFTADEKHEVNTASLMQDQLDEHLYRILLKPVLELEPRPHKIAKYIYNNCMNIEKIKELGNRPILDVLEVMGGWPVLKGADWNETNWSWENSLLKLREFVGYRKNLFRDNSTEEDSENEIDDDLNLITNDHNSIESNYLEYMFKVAVALGAENSEETKKELNDSLQLGLAFNAISNHKFTKTKFSRSANIESLRTYRKLLTWMKNFDIFKLKNSPSKMVLYNISDFENIDLLMKKVSKRTIANYVLWRVVDLAVPFLGEEVEGASKYLQESFGLIDKEQRWKMCTRLTNRFAQLATGSLYIKDFFSEESRLAATKMVEDIKREFQETISSSKWMDKETKSEALKNINNMKSYIGYDEQLLDITKVEKYYVESSKKFTDTFFHLVLQLNILTTDKKFRQHVYNETDWTKYAKPTSFGASYNQKDNTIHFSAAFLQAPNFDKDRPSSMNYGAIGSVVAHEMTHCFDRFIDKSNSWSKEELSRYQKKVQCLTEQYSTFEEPEIKVKLNGTVTSKEDIADNGGLKLAYRAYQKWSKTSEEIEPKLIALSYNPKQLFWISYAQFYCTIQRKEIKLANFAINEVHSFDRFRVIGPLMNSEEFAKDFGCSAENKMSLERERCSIW